MTSTKYYYEENDAGERVTVEEPGELCDFCGKLATICKKGALIVVSETSPILEEYGKSGDLHAHEECLRSSINKYKSMLKAWEKDLGKRGYELAEVILNDPLSEKEGAKKFLANSISFYLRNLQGGGYGGAPTVEELSAAGNLHAFLESVSSDEIGS